MFRGKKTYCLQPRGRGRADGSTTDTEAGTACHSAITPPPTHKASERPLYSFRQRVSKAPIFTNFISGNYFSMTPSRKMVRPPQPLSKRGKITSLSHKSMVRLKRSCAKVVGTEKAYTFCLSYGENFPDARESKKELIRLQRWISSNFRGFGMYWKREPQKRGASHYHILAFLGDDEEAARTIGEKILAKWCEIANDSYGGEQYAKALKVHLHRSNFEKMRGESFFNYLAKYISKSADAMPDGYDLEGGGRWWGYFNKSSIPWSEEEISTTEELDDRENKMLERVCYRIRQERARKAADRSSELVASGAILDFNRHVQYFLAQPTVKDSMAGFSPAARRKFALSLLDPERKWSKPRKLRREGTVVLLGNKDHLVSCLDRFVSGSIDYEGRRRIFSDDYEPRMKVPAVSDEDNDLQQVAPS